ncbi:MAG: SRPBCC family protein [Pseudomonadales bacterium]
MMQTIEQTLDVNVPAAQVWRVLSDFSSIEKFSPTVKHSPILGDVKTGLGAKRACSFHDGTSAVEEIVGYREGESLEVELTEHPMPFKRFFAQMKVVAIDERSSRISMAMSFEVKYGVLGRLLVALVMRRMVLKVLKKVLSGLALHASSGELIGRDLPAGDKVAQLLRQPAA